MKRSIIIACALTIGSSLGFAESDAAKQGQNQPSVSTSQYQPQDMRLFDSSMIENKKIMDQDGKNLGKLERLLIDAESGRVRFAVVQVDKEWSLNDPEVIVPWATLQISRIGDKDLAIKIEATRDKLMNAPQFDKKLVHQLKTREAGQPIYTYWGVTWHDDQLPASTAHSSSTPAPSSTTSSSNTSTDLSLSSGTSTSSTPTTGGTTSTEPTTTTAPTTTTDGSLGTQPVGNSGTSDSPKPDNSQGQPSPGGESSTDPLSDPDYNVDTPDRAAGGNQTD
jgi:sporulation protein YlmC with PRC-barrel domain